MNKIPYPLKKIGVGLFQLRYFLSISIDRFEIKMIFNTNENSRSCGLKEFTRVTHLVRATSERQSSQRNDIV